MFFASLDAMFGDMKMAGVTLGDIVVINDSAQQHGHVYLNRNAQSIFAKLDKQGSGNSDLVALLEGCLSYRLAPIWMTSNTAKQADFIRNFVGGKERMIELSGSNAPLRFTGMVIRQIAERFPEIYKETGNIQLLSSLVPAILTGNSKVPVDFGNACGTSLMSYSEKQWSNLLIKAVSDGLPGGERALRGKLPPIVAPDTIIGNMATFFIEKYGFSPSCKIVAGSGDNPQSKVLVANDLLSLGTSFVIMVSTDGERLDMNGFANAMYDGIGRPFMFGCRTNGAMVWDQLRAMHGMGKEEYGPAEEALHKIPVARYMVFWQPRNESFPPSSSFDIVRVSHETQDLGADYAGLIESTLASIYKHSRDFMKEGTEPLYVTGGVTDSPSIMRRVAAIWNRPIISVEKGGAALGAAVAGAYALSKYNAEEIDVEEFSVNLLKRMKPMLPRSDDVAAYHNPDGYLNKLALVERQIIKKAYQLSKKPQISDANQTFR